LAVQLKRKRKAKVELRPKMYREASEQANLLQGVLIPLILLVVLSGLVALPSSFRWKGLAIIWGWVLLALLILAGAIGRRRRRLLARGLQIKVMPNTFPEVKQLLTRMCKALGIREPEAFVVRGELREFRTLGLKPPYFMVLDEAIQEHLSRAEFEALVAHELGYIRSGHVFWRTLVLTAQELHPLWRLLGLPLQLFAFGLRVSWLHTIEFTAGRIALLLIRDSKTCISALLKRAVEADPLSNLEPHEVDDYLGRGTLSVQSRDVEDHYRVGTFVRSSPLLHGRIEDLARFGQSDAAKACWQVIKELSGEE
jgi:Zn-dependent protease with chaperone function